MEPMEEQFHPPTEPVPVQRARQGSAWPGVVGSIALVFGVLGIAQGGLTLLGSIVMRFVSSAASAAPGGGAAAMSGITAMEKYAVLVYTVALTGSAVAVLLLVGGIQLLRRNPGATAWLVTWGMLKICWGGGSVWMNVHMQREQMRIMQTQVNSPMPAALMGGVMELLMTGGIVLGLMWAWALPVFVLIWFSRRKVREEVRSWRARGPGVA